MPNRLSVTHKGFYKTLQKVSLLIACEERTDSVKRIITENDFSECSTPAQLTERLTRLL